MIDSQVEADILRKEAKDILSKQLLAIMGIYQDNIGLTSMDRFVDCIINCAILEACNVLRDSKT
jgi:hypothetical protein